MLQSFHTDVLKMELKIIILWATKSFILISSCGQLQNHKIIESGYFASHTVIILFLNC